MNKILRSFVNEHRRLPRTDASRDLAAYRAAHPQEAEAPARTRSRSDSPWAWVSVAAVMVVALVLSLTLTLAKPATSPSGQDNPAQDPQGELHYCDSSTLCYVPMESIEAFNDKYGQHVSYNSNYMTECSEIIDTEAEECIGVRISSYGFVFDGEELVSVDETFREAQITCFTGSARIPDIVAHFEFVTDEMEVDELRIKYYKASVGRGWVYEFNWWCDGYEFVASVGLYQKIEVEQAFRQYILAQNPS